MSKVSKESACFPVAWEKPNASAIQALAAGTATEEQQKDALAFIIENICGTYDLSYRPDSPYETAFAEGRRFAGLQIVKLLKVNLAALRQAGK